MSNAPHVPLTTRPTFDRVNAIIDLIRQNSADIAGRGKVKVTIDCAGEVVSIKVVKYYENEHRRELAE